MSETHARDESPKTAEPAPDAKPPDGGVELTDEQLDKVSGGLASNLLKRLHDTGTGQQGKIG